MAGLQLADAPQPAVDGHAAGLVAPQRDAQAGTFNEAEYLGLNQRFNRWVGIAWLTPMIGLALMVLKPF